MRNLMIIIILLFRFVSAQDETTPLRITHGPYLQAPTDSSVTVVWFTNKKCLSRVEYKPDDGRSFYSSVPKTVYPAHHGLIDANNTVHVVRVNGLEPGQVYQYRVVSTEITDFRAYRTLFGTSVSTDVYGRKPLRMQTLNPDKRRLNFSVLSDIHQNAGLLSKLLRSVDWQDTDLIFYNGDIINDFQREEQVFAGFLDTTVAVFGGNLPFIYARGNHETRGVLARKLMDYFPTPTGRYYYAFRQGPVFFIILDSGEDKPDTDIEYSGLVAFDDYRREQQRWLKKVVSSEDFRRAPYRIVFSHIPIYSTGTWHGELKNRELWGPILNEADIDLVFSGHQHRYSFIEKGAFGNSFPNIIGDNDTILHTRVTEEGMTITVQKPDGTVVDRRTIQRREER